MMVEETETTGLDLVSIPSPAVLAPPVPLINPPEDKWTPQDDMCAKLFGPWNNLPCYDHMNEHRLLRELDSIVVLFEAKIQHTDAGFQAWRERHKKVMDKDDTKIPRFPSLHIVHDEKRIWQNEKWEQRYHYLVFQRDRIVGDRLARLLKWPPKVRDKFFGERPAPPRAVLKKTGGGAYSRLVLKCDWWKPLDFLLERMAQNLRMSPAEVKARFWMDEHSISIKAQA